jgi:hypothetical protein
MALGHRQAFFGFFSQPSGLEFFRQKTGSAHPSRDLKARQTGLFS